MVEYFGELDAQNTPQPHREMWSILFEKTQCDFNLNQIKKNMGKAEKRYILEKGIKKVHGQLNNVENDLLTAEIEKVDRVYKLRA